LAAIDRVIPFDVRASIRRLMDGCYKALKILPFTFRHCGPLRLRQSLLLCSRQGTAILCPSLSEVKKALT
jgi:hypothetical protein